MTHRMRKIPRSIGLMIVVAVSALMLAAAPAFADTTPADGQYGAVKGENAGGGGGGSLPFTGLDLLALTAVGTVLVAGGVGLRAASRR
jgi:hypothetical protein